MRHCLLALLLTGCGDLGLDGGGGRPEEPDETFEQLPYEIIGLVPSESERATWHLSFGDVAIGIETRRAFTIRNSGTTSLEVKLDEAEPHPFALGLTSERNVAAPGSAIPVYVDFLPDREAEYARTATIEGNFSPPITILLSGNGTPPALVCASRVEFGAVAAGATTTMGVACTNEGSLDVVLSEPSIGGPNADEFSVQVPKALVRAGGTIEIPVTFAPMGDPGERSASLELEIDGGTPLPDSILHGQVVAVP